MANLFDQVTLDGIDEEEKKKPKQLNLFDQVELPDLKEEPPQETTGNPFDQVTLPDLEQEQPSPLRSMIRNAVRSIPPLDAALNIAEANKLKPPPVIPQTPESLDKLDTQNQVTNLAATAMPGLNAALIKTPLGRRVTGDVASGISGTTGSTLAAIPALETLLGKETLVGDKANDAANKLRSLSRKLMPDNPNAFDQVASAAGAMATFWIPGGVAGAGVSMLPKMGVLAAKLAPAIGTGVSTILESATEAGNVYQDQLEKGFNKEVAAKHAFSDFWQNTLLIGLTNHLGIGSEKLKGVQKALASMTLEGLQEGYQDVISSLENGELPDWKQVALDSGIGGLLGFGAGPLMSEANQKTTTISKESLGEKPYNYVKTKFPALMEGIEGMNVPLSAEKFHPILQKATAAGEEVLLMNGSQEEANDAVLRTFQKEMEPHLNQAQAEETKPPEPRKNAEAKFVGYKDMGPEFAPEPIYRLSDKGAIVGENVPRSTLEKEGIKVPETPSFQEHNLTTIKKDAKSAALDILTANKIDDRVMVKLVDYIAADKSILEKGYGEKATPENMDISGSTAITEDRLNGFINLVKGEGEETGRHEAFHAVTEMLFDENEMNIVTKKYGDKETAAEAFAQYRKGVKTGSSVIDNIFESIKEFLEKIGNYLSENKFTTANELFNAIETGKLGGRTLKSLQGPGGETMYRAAFHGSPHEFNKFDISKIGTGEGEQAFGHGLYFAGNKEVAKFYKDKLSSQEYTQTYKGIPLKDISNIDVRNAVLMIARNAMTKDEYLAEMKTSLARQEASKLSDWAIPENRERTINDLRKSIKDVEEIDLSKIGERKVGRLYKVDIPEDEDYLAWDKPFSEQSDKVKEILKKDKNLKDFIAEDSFGQMMYQKLIDVYGSAKDASQHLNSSGIPGIKYNDQLSRGKKEGTSNYVLFDDKNVNILETQYRAKQKDQTQTPEFRKWFGDSKVVDEKGKPLVVYHGSGEKGINVFDTEKAGTILTGDWGKGIYFTPSKWMGEGYKLGAVKQQDENVNRRWKEMENAAKSFGTDVMSAWIDLQAGKITQEQYDNLNQYDKRWRDALSEAEKSDKGETYAVYLKVKNPLNYTYGGITEPFLSERAKEQGNDGIIVRNESGDIEEIVVFSPTQIKSATGNRGTFDPNNPNILYRATPKQDPDPKRTINKINIPSRRGEPKIYTERMALRESLNRQAHVAAEAAKEGESKFKETKKAVIDEIERRLPTSDRGQFLRMLSQANTTEEFIDAITRLDGAVEKSQRKILTNSIKRESQRIAASKSIAVDYKFKVASILNDILFQKPRQATLQRVADLKRYIESRMKAGEDVSVPNYVLEKLRILSSKPISEFKTTELEDVLGQMRRLADLGRTKLRARQELDILNKDADLKDLAQGTTPINSRPISQAFPGEKLPFGDNFMNAYNGAINKASDINNAIRPMDPFFDTLDGNMNYTGPNYRIFKERVDMRFGEYLNELKNIREDAKVKGKGLTPTNMERIGAYATRVQEGGMEKIYNNYGIPKSPTTTEEMNKKAEFDKKIGDVKLNDQEMGFYTWMRDKLEELRPRIAETMKNVYNADMGEVKNYFPFITDYTLMSDMDVQSSIFSQMMGLSKSVPKGFTIERTGPGHQKINLNAADVFMRHMDDALYLVNVGETVKNLGEIANSPFYRQIAGDEGSTAVREWVDTLAKKGGGVGGQQIRLLDKLRTNVGMATLGFKLSSALVQLTPIGEGATLIGRYAFKGAMDYGTNPEWRDFVRENMPELRERAGDDPAYKEFVSTHGVKSKVGEAGYYLIKQLDELAASSVAVGAYQKYMSDHNLKTDLNKPNQEALNYAQRVVRRTQSSGFFKDLPSAITRGKLTGSRSMDRALFQFQNFVLNQYSLLTHEGLKAGVMKGNVGQSASIYMWSTLMAIAGTGMRLGLKDLWDFMFGRVDKKPQEFSDKLLQGTVKEMLGKIPFMSQAMSLIGYKSFPVPSIDWMMKAAEGISAASTGKEAKTRAQGRTKAIVNLARPLGIPGTLQLEEFIRILNSSNKRKG